MTESRGLLRRVLFALAHRAWPRARRARHRRALRQTFDSAWQAEQATPAARRVWRRLGLTADTAVAGLAERRADRRATSVARTGGAPADHAGLWQTTQSDLHAAMRALAARPAFATLVVLTLGLGLGASTAIFAVVDTVLLRPLPYPNDHELIRLGERDAGRGLTGASVPAINEWRAFPGLSSLAAFEASSRLFATSDVPERVHGASVSPEFFATLGVDAALGATMRPGEPFFDPEPRIVLGHALWQRRFGGDPDIIGRAIQIEDTSPTVIGVMPPGFAFPTGTEFWRTLPREMQLLADAPTLHFLEVVARRAEGTSVDDVRARLAAWKSSQPSDDEPWVVFATTLRDEARGGVGPALRTVFAGVGLLLLVACANVMALLLANGRARTRDLAMRMALGASRARLVRQLAMEGALMSTAAAALALVVTRSTQAIVIDLSADQIPRIDGLGVSAPVVAFAASVGLTAAALVTAWPAWSLTRDVSRSGALGGSRAEAGSRGSRRVFGALVSIEFAMAVVLVAGAGLLLGSYRQLTSVDPGMAPDRVGIARVVLPLGPEWRPNERRRQFFDALLERIGALPGIERAAFVSRLPLDQARGGVDVSAADEPGVTVQALSVVASPGYFETIGAGIVAGRGFTDADREGAPSAIVINDLVAERLFGSAAAAVGRQIAFDYFTGDVTATVVGVTRPIRYDDLTADLRPEMFLPTGQGTVVPMALVFRTAGDPAALVPSIRAAVAEVDPSSTVALDEVATLEGRLARTVARPRFFLVLVGVFAALALLLAAGGVYGTTAYWLAGSRRELGLRLALGATPRQVIRQVTARGAAMAATGVAAGLIVVLVSGRFIAHLLFGVAPSDPPTLFGAGLALVAAGAAATWWPARGVGRIAVADTLRH